jgi:hypothetical protein
MAGETVPAIFWVENGIAVLKTNYAALVPAKINKWLDGK